MPTAFDPKQAVSTGLLGSSRSREVTLGPCLIDYLNTRRRMGRSRPHPRRPHHHVADGEVGPDGKPKSYQQVYSIGDLKTHNPSPDKRSFDGPLVKSSNFNFFLEHLINAGFPAHLLQTGNIFVLNGTKMVVEQRKPQARQIATKQEQRSGRYGK